MFTPQDSRLSAGIISFAIEGQTAEETVRKLGERKVVASASPYKVSYARLGPSLADDEDEVDAALRAARYCVGNTELRKEQELNQERKQIE